MTSGAAFGSTSRTESTTPGRAGPSWIPAQSATGRIIADRDWGTTPLGPIEAWPAALKRTVTLCLEAPFPFAIAQMGLVRLHLRHPLLTGARIAFGKAHVKPR